jgi:AraC family transcriptional regulator
MNPVGKALWFIESHFESDVTLEAIAGIAGVSRFHITRAFGDATGHSIMRYVRARRLTESARALARGAPDILAVALQAGYGSHEAFTRAFREQFGVTPEAVRAQGALGNLPLVEPIRMDQTLIDKLAPPRFENARALLLAGLGERYTCESSAGIPAQWQRFLPSFGHIPGQVGNVAYGARSTSDDQGNFDYLCGVAVADFSRVPMELTRLRIPEQRYAVFTHGDHISTIRRTWHTIWTQWLPQSGHELLDAPDFERYGENFDSRTGQGEVEIWIPLKR